jgi:hypothetical protein
MTQVSTRKSPTVTVSATAFVSPLPRLTVDFTATRSSQAAERGQREVGDDADRALPVAVTRPATRCAKFPRSSNPSCLPTYGRPICRSSLQT